MTTRSSRLVRATRALVLAASLVASHAGAAEPSLADVETARTLYVEGLELRDRDRLVDSLGRFRAAHALAATPITSLELGRAHALVLQLLEAREVLLSVDRMPVRPEESPKAANARLEARALAEQIKNRIPSVHVSFDPRPSGIPRVTIDGAVVPPEALAAARRLNPGKHVVVAELDGARASAEVELGESEARPVILTLAAPKAADGPPPALAADRAGPPEPWFYGGLVTAGVGVLVGTVTGVIAIGRASNLDTQCTGTHCARSAQGDLDASRTWGTVSTVAFVVAGVGAGVALVAWLMRPSVRPTSHALAWTW